MKKKLLTLLLAGCMVFSLTACGGENAENSTEQSTEQGTEQTEDSTATASKLLELGEYKGLTFTETEIVVTDEEVESEVQYLLASSPVKNSQEVATETSIVNIDYVGKKDDVAFEGGTAQGTELDLGNSNFIPGFAESIVGMKVGETKDCPMTFPADYHAAELAGAEVVFTITVNDCWENVPAELNDEFAVSQGYESLDALYQGMREYLEKAKTDEAESNKQSELVRQALENCTFEIDEEEVKAHMDALKSQYETYASYYGYDLETYVTLATGQTMEVFEEYCRESAITSIKSALLQDAIVAEEGFELTDEVYAARVQEYMKTFGYETAEEFEAAYTKEMITKQILADTAMEVLVENAVPAE